MVRNIPYSTKRNNFHIVLIIFLLNLLCNYGHCQKFPCDSATRLYFFQNIGGQKGSLSYITGYTTPTPTVTTLFPMPTSQHNGLAANQQDNYLYFLAGEKLNRLDASGNATTVCSLSFSSIYGCFDSWGRYWTVDGDSLVAIDVNTCAIVKGPFPISGGGMLDIVFNPYDCMLYYNNVRCDTNGVIDPTYTGINFAPAGTYGGAAIGIDGNIYGMGGTSDGNLSVKDLSTNTSQNVYNFTPGPSFGRSDMASFTCFIAHAQFSTSPQSACSLTYNFSDQSTGTINSWLWNFGDPSSGTNDTSSAEMVVKQQVHKT